MIYNIHIESLINSEIINTCHNDYRVNILLIILILMVYSYKKDTADS